ncbi:MAG TPA: 16S rRNA processing protein RimM [Bacteroidales bacterium]|nr:16S rRNA processing protein RimM [Bacteroidales bacterium]
MLSKDSCLLLGSLLKTNGNKGEVTLKFVNTIPEKIKNLESVFIDIDGKLVPFFIEYIKVKSPTNASVKFEDLENESDAKEFLGLDFYIDRTNKIFSNISDEFIDVVGYIVKDENKIIVGEVVEFIDIAQNPLLRVQTKESEILLPAHDDLIIEVDDDERYIIMNIPEGLLNLDEVD